MLLKTLQSNGGETVDRLFNRFWKWLLWSLAFALIIHCLFKTPAPFEFLEGAWNAGDILTYVSTVLLAWIAFWQNKRYKQESDNYQEKQNELTRETNNKFLQIQENINQQTNLMVLLESEKMTPFFRIATGLTDSGRGRQLKIVEKSTIPLCKFHSYTAHLKNIGVNGIANITCRNIQINGVSYQVESTPEIFGVDPNEICFIVLPHIADETQTLLMQFEVLNVIGHQYDIEYKLPFDHGHCQVGEMISIKRIGEV